MEDLDRVAKGAAAQQLADLTALGLDWDGEILWQSSRSAAYQDAIQTLTQAGKTYECFCTRREIQQAASAPHVTPGRYPGTCRHLTTAQRTEHQDSGRPAALRLRAGVNNWTVQDELFGEITGHTDDLVLRRNDGVFAYNLAVVVDDAAQGIDQVVRGDDLLSSAPQQAYLAHLLSLPQPVYAHVPLARNPANDRLAKRDGAVTLSDLHLLGWRTPDVLTLIARSAGLNPTGAAPTAQSLVQTFDLKVLTREPWIFGPAPRAAPERQHN